MHPQGLQQLLQELQDKLTQGVKRVMREVELSYSALWGETGGAQRMKSEALLPGVNLVRQEARRALLELLQAQVRRGVCVEILVLLLPCVNLVQQEARRALLELQQAQVSRRGVGLAVGAGCWCVWMGVLVTLGVNGCAHQWVCTLGGHQGGGQQGVDIKGINGCAHQVWGLLGVHSKGWTSRG